MTDARNVWASLGFRENPFHTNPLRATRDDHAVYLPRPLLERDLGTWILSEKEGGIFIEGSVGVGKTSLVHQTHYALRKKHPELLLCHDIIEIQDATDAVSFLLSVLATCLRNLAGQAQHATKSKAFKALEREVRQSQIMGWSAGLQVLAVGPSAGKASAPTQPHAVTLAALTDSLDRMQKLLDHHHIAKTVLILNNLDNVGRDHVASLLHDVRDAVLQRPGLVFNLIGPVGTRATFAARADHRRIDRVLSSATVQVGAFSLEETLQIVQSRVHHYAQPDASPVCPVPESIIRVLYDVSHGELRYILQRITDIVQKVSRETALIGPMDSKTAWGALQSVVTHETQHIALTAKKRSVLQKIANAGRAQPKEFKTFGFNNAAAFHNYLKEFAQKGLVTTEADPADKRLAVYVPRGDIVVLYGRKIPA